MAWIVKHCFMDYDECWKNFHSSYETEQEAEDAAENLRAGSPWNNEWMR